VCRSDLKLNGLEIVAKYQIAARYGCAIGANRVNSNGPDP